MSSKRSLFLRLVPCRCLLEQVPKEIFSFEKTLEELYLDANQIEELPKQLFNCQLLYRLSLPDNDLTVLPPGIANLINLKELDVSKNSIQEFPENIKNCKVLAIVEASVNPISKLPEGFTQLLSLNQLYLNDAFLEFLPASFGRLTKLQILELRENQLKMLPKSMHKLTQLERLDLGSNEFTEVPEVLEQLTGIRELWMDGNKLTFLPGVSLALILCAFLSSTDCAFTQESTTGCLPQTQHLSIILISNPNIVTENAFSALQFFFYTVQLTTLDELDCSFNEIEALPSTIGQCVNLRTFAADHNLLTQMPPEMGSLKNVTVLFLHSNKLETLPEEMGDMQKLKVINFSDNKLKNLPYSFTKLNQMTAMWLSENQSKPLIPLQKEEDPETRKTVLTNYMFPQQTRAEDYVPNSDSESFNPSLWEEQRKQRPMCMPDQRRMPGMEGEYMTYRDIHAAGRGPLQMSQALHRPLSARTYSMDGPNAPRPQSARPPPHELPERTMSVSDFNYQQGSPSKRPSMRVKSEHSLLDGPVSGGGRVPADWRDQVMRHIEAKKMEKVWPFLQIVNAKTSIAVAHTWSYGFVQIHNSES
uniref:Protein LAP2-like n=1 Tax=Sinocyclocheilus grahami TaxID=75366 RepID=A0A672S7E1_SINGR